MAAFKIKKSARLRRRFIQSEALLELELWMDEAFRLKDRILTESTFQLVGDKSILSVNSKTGVTTILVEVLGIPQNNFKVIDFDPCEQLVHECPETLFEVDFETLKSRGKELFGLITHPLEDSYHLVFDGQKIALHFFIQKDYIHS